MKQFEQLENLPERPLSELRRLRAEDLQLRAEQRELAREFDSISLRLYDEHIKNKAALAAQKAAILRIRDRQIEILDKQSEIYLRASDLASGDFD